MTSYRFGPEGSPAAPSPSATPLLIVHGLYGSARNWNVIAKRLAGARPVISVDMRNHGDSPRHDSHGYPDMAGDLAQVIDAEAGGRAHVMGHSMGGKAAMVLALNAPEQLASLCVADIAPVAYSHSQIRYARAMMEMDLTGVTSRGQADARLAETVPDAGIRAFLLQSLDLKAQPARWRLNLPVLAAEMDRITGWPGDVTGRFEGPALFLSGALSDYVKPEHRDIIRGFFPKARFASIPGAGHWLHAEKPREFEAALGTWLDRVEAA